MSEESAESYGLKERIGFVAGLALIAVMLLLPPPASMTLTAWRVAAVGLLMAVWWMTEAVPIAVAALLPLALFPLLGATSFREAAEPFAQSPIYLYMGGFMIAIAAERWGLHRRVALGIVSAIGTNPPLIVGGFMVATAFISMWVSNTATALMMIPMGRAIVELSAEQRGDAASNNTNDKNFSAALMLGITYASSIGGMGTLIGTPPNAIFAGFVQETLKTQVNFLSWMLIGVPMILALLPLAWLVIVKGVCPVSSEGGAGSKETIRQQQRGLGKMSTGELIVAIVFVLTSMLWIAEPFLREAVPAFKLTDAGIAMCGALVLFLIPMNFSKGEFVLTWSDMKKLPWGVLILFGGGLSLSQAIGKSGLAKWLGEAMQVMSVLPAWLIVLIVITMIVFFSEVASNAATVATFLPIVAALAPQVGVNTYTLLIAATLAGSCGFMLPVATPPNTIAYATGYISTAQMARAGIWLNLISIALILLLCYTLVPLVFAP